MTDACVCGVPVADHFDRKRGRLACPEARRLMIAGALARRYDRLLDGRPLAEVDAAWRKEPAYQLFPRLAAEALAAIQLQHAEAAGLRDWPIDRRPVKSSNILSVGYMVPFGDPAHGVLDVEFLDGSVSRYYHVPQSAYTAIMNAPSIGKAFHALVRTQDFPWQQLAPSRKERV